MNTREILTFRIDSFTPDTLPMARLAEYLAQLAELYGSKDRVHFDKVKKGSALLQVAIEDMAVGRVVERIQNAKSASPEPDIQKAYKAIDALLRKDNAVGAISRPSTGKIIEFPGRKAPQVESYALTQDTTVDGIVIKIGGRDETIPVLIRDAEGREVRCQIRGELRAKELAQHYLGGTLRFHGQGKWIRYPSGRWDLDSLVIDSFSELDDVSVDVVLDELSKLKGMGWKAMDTPIDSWKRLRGVD
jgi:hypothetical protein